MNLGRQKIKILTITLLLFSRHTGFGHFISIFIYSSYRRFGQKSPENQTIKEIWLNADNGMLARNTHTLSFYDIYMYFK